MKKLVIIQGYSGAGKTTIARSLARKYRIPVVEYDMFLFGLHPFGSSRLRKKEYDASQAHLKSAVTYYMKEGRMLILEGALMSINAKLNTFKLEDFFVLAKKYKYRVEHILLVSDKKVAKERMMSRGTVVKSKSYDKIVKQVNKYKKSHVHVLDTTHLTKRQVLNRVEKLAHMK